VNEKFAAYNTAKLLYRVFTVLQVLCLGVLFAPFYVPFITKAYFGDVFVAVYRYLALELGALFVVSGLALFFRYRARVLQQQLGETIEITKL
jgi:hypothetical protein